MDTFRNEIISRIRSCLISTKGQITLRQLEDDYRTLLGERIPYVKLGHKTLESFICSVPTLLTSRTSNGELLVDAQVSEKSAHISTMVHKQKSTGVKKQVRIAPRVNRRFFQPPPETNKWRPKKNPTQQEKKHYESSSRLTSHNQFVSRYNKPTVPSKIVVPERKKDSPPRELKRYNSSPEGNKNQSQPKEYKRVDSSPESFIENNGTSQWDEDLCSPLSSTMKRISRIMSEISVERDSGNSSPTTEFATSYKLSGDPICDIRSFAAHHKLGDVDVKFTETKAKKAKVKQYHCRITVGQHKYSSYPEDFFDKNAAERHASQKALDDLMQKYSRRRSLLISSNDDIIERIPPMLEKHNNAVWCWQIEADYIDKYNEQLPPDWLRVIDNSSHVSIEKCLGGYVLKHCNPDDKGKKLDISLNVGDVSVPCNTLNLGENNRLYAVITAAHSANEVWCQHCGTPEYEKFVEMTERMELFYQEHKSELVPKSINFGSCYVILHEGSWIRVRASSIHQDGFVDCFLIDYGEEVHVPTGNVYVLRREFALEQAQAFVCRLDGLEELYEASVDSEHLTSLVGKEFVLEIVVEETSDDDDITIPVVMYDVITQSSINEELINLLTIESAMPVLDKVSRHETVNQKSSVCCRTPSPKCTFRTSKPTAMSTSRCAPPGTTASSRC
jgi:hypothetical protein